MKFIFTVQLQHSEGSINERHSSEKIFGESPATFSSAESPQFK